MEKQLNLFFGFLENEKKVSSNTLQSYKRDLKQFRNYLETNKIQYNKVTEKDMKESILSKGIRADVYLEGDDKIYNVEMQTTNSSLQKRSRYYHGVIDVDSLQPGEGYDDLKETYVIFICTFDPFDKNSYKYSVSNQCTDVKDVIYDDGNHTIFLNTKGQKGNVSGDLKTFLMAVDGLFDSSKYSAIMKERIERIKNNNRWRKSYMFQHVRDWDNENKGKRETLSSLLDKGVITIEQAAEELGKPVEEAKELLDNVK